MNYFLNYNAGEVSVNTYRNADNGGAMKIKHYEFNDDVIGIVVSLEDGRNLNLQLEKIESNHPQPNFYLFAGCEGDETHLAFSEEELQEITSEVNGYSDIKEFLEHFNREFYTLSEKTIKDYENSHGEIEILTDFEIHKAAFQTAAYRVKISN